jgi:7-cyano-7-deazaguanine reductase
MVQRRFALGNRVDVPREYDPSILFPIERAIGRAEINLADRALPFVGVDRWYVYELSWLDGQGKPQVDTAVLTVPATSPYLIESKSLKLYMNSFAFARHDSREAVAAVMEHDISEVAEGHVVLTFGLPPLAANGGYSLDKIDVALDDYGPPNAEYLSADTGSIVDEVLSSSLLKSNCPVTGQPDWATVIITYRGPEIDRIGLLRYLVSFRDHAEFQEQCIERIYCDLMQHVNPQRLSVEARYTRRGGLAINPWRGSVGLECPAAGREDRQ